MVHLFRVSFPAPTAPDSLVGLPLSEELDLPIGVGLLDVGREVKEDLGAHFDSGRLRRG